jgi:hypothetical protein
MSEQSVTAKDSPHKVDLGYLLFNDALKIRIWLTANASDNWFLHFGVQSVSIAFLEEGDMIKFMLMKAEIVDPVPT